MATMRSLGGQREEEDTRLLIFLKKGLLNGHIQAYF